MVETAVRADEAAAARRALRAQIARLERRLAGGPGGPPSPVAAGGPLPPAAARLLDLGELEAVRDALVARLAAAREAARRSAERQAAARRRLDAMLRDPAAHRFARIPNTDVGGHGCGVWHVRPRLSLLGILMGWWEVKLSSGCPLRHR